MFVPSLVGVLPVLGGFRVSKCAAVEFAEVQDAFGYRRGGLEIAGGWWHISRVNRLSLRAPVVTYSSESRLSSSNASSARSTSNSGSCSYRTIHVQQRRTKATILDWRQTPPGVSHTAAMGAGGGFVGGSPVVTPAIFFFSRAFQVSFAPVTVDFWGESKRRACPDGESMNRQTIYSRGTGDRPVHLLPPSIGYCPKRQAYCGAKHQSTHQSPQ